MYLAAQDMKLGSEEYNETFEVAVRMFPDDEVANLNAANAAMARGDMKNAEYYLKKVWKLTAGCLWSGDIRCLEEGV